jgi:hypothetical protein
MTAYYYSRLLALVTLSGIAWSAAWLFSGVHLTPLGLLLIVACPAWWYGVGRAPSFLALRAQQRFPRG